MNFSRTALVPKLPWRAFGLVASTAALFAASRSAWPVALLQSVTYALAIAAGARLRVLVWLIAGNERLPPAGGEWGSALCAAALWFAAWTLASWRDGLLGLVLALSLAHGLAKLGCARLGCCGWRHPHMVRGQLLDATLLLLIAGASLVAVAVQDRSSWAIAAAAALVVARGLSMTAQGRPLLERGGVALIAILAIALLAN